MKNQRFSIPISAAIVSALLVGPLNAGVSPPPPPPTPPPSPPPSPSPPQIVLPSTPFIPPAPGGVFDPVFVPTPAPTNLSPSGTLTNAATRLIVVELRAARKFCRRMPSKEYIIDCLGDAIQSVANDLPSSGEYGDAKRVLEDAARKLRSVARENASNLLPTGRVGVPGNPDLRSSTPLVPVARDSLNAANASAIEILEEAETALLRSTENSAARKVHYQRISRALGSNKVILRST